MVFPCHATVPPLPTLSTLCAGRLGQRAAVCARRAARPAQVVAARWPSVVGPRLQIRLARFDSGPRLQHKRITDSSVVRFFSSAHLRIFSGQAVRRKARAMPGLQFTFVENWGMRYR